MVLVSLSVMSDKVHPIVVPRWSVTTGSSDDESSCSAPPVTIKVMVVVLSATAGVILAIAKIDRMTEVITTDTYFTTTPLNRMT
jgi:hypothetical protein